MGENCISEKFFDAFDEFPFFNCISNFESGEESVELSKVSQLESIEEKANEVIIRDTNSTESRFSNSLRHRSSFRFGEESKDSIYNSQVISEISQLIEGITPREKRNKILLDLKDHEKVVERSNGINGENKQIQENSSITSEIGDSYLGEHDDDSFSSSSFLVLLAGFVIKAVGFQISLLVSFFTFPIRLCYCSLLFMTNPCRALRNAKERITNESIRKWGVFCDRVALFLNEQFKGQKSFWNLAVRFGWGLLWSVYICFVLSGFLIMGFIIGGVIMRYIVEEPIQMTETLNFDYTKTSPVAFVPIMSCSGVSNGVNFKVKGEVGKNVRSRVIPLNHKLQLTISLTLPESEYNRNLGIFQVRADFLSENGEVTASLRHPCMLRFKSHLISYLETFLKSVPLLAGYSSEAQVVKLKMRGFTEGYRPTSCLRVILEQRAEYRSGAGIPEIYAASMLLESELPLFKRILWFWRKTIFIWLSMVVFLMELLLILACCRPILIPRVRPSDGSANSNAPQSTVSQVVNS